MARQGRMMERIGRLVEIGIALSAEKDIDALIETILLGAKELTNADGGTLYLMEEDGRALKMAILRNDSLGFAMGGTTGKPVPFDPIPLYGPDGPNHHNVVTHAVLNDTTINIADAYNAEGFEFSGTRAFDRKTGYRSISFLTVPMKNHEDDIIGVLQLLNAKDEKTGRIIAFSPEMVKLTEAFASQAAIALTNRRLIEDLKKLFESLIRLIAAAIDEKSPYTGGHCRRVPVLTMLLADAAARAEEGPLKDFSMEPEDRYELEIAAWLHDCGKITTPEYVVDKATKLETIYDRVHEIDARFEILRRDAELAVLRRRIEALECGGRVEEESLERELQAIREKLQEEREFIHRANIGGEFMSGRERSRIEEIAKRTWRDATGKQRSLLTPDEVENLCIPKGTLTEDERRIINNHIGATIKMLKSLPFPKHLKRVPEFAGGHHERMDGRGYPKGLTGEQMPVQARIMAIADIFEALTAKDRPYKPAKKLPEALGILAAMKRDGHIDPDLFDIFVKEKVYEEYARRYLDPEQIDEVDPQHLLD